MDIIERSKDAIRKAKAILPFIKDGQAKITISECIQGMEEALAHAIQKEAICPADTEQELNVIYDYIDQMYNKLAAN